MLNVSAVRHLIGCVVIAVIGLPSVLSAQSHVVNPAELRKEMLAAASARQRNMEDIAGFLSSTRAQRVLGSLGIVPARVKVAVSSLDDQELARLAARTQTAQADFAAGEISERELIYILIGIAALILIIVAVH